MHNLWRPVKKLLTMDRATEVLGPYIDDFLLSIRRGLTAYQQIPAVIRADFRPRTAANTLNDLIVADAIRRFSGHEPKIYIDEDFDGALFVFDGLASVRFKKVNAKLRPSNIDTDRQTKIQYQYELDGVVRCTQITAGYSMNEAFTQVLNAHVVCWHGERIHWAFPLGDAIEPFLFSLGRKPRERKTPDVRSKTTRKKKKGG